MQNTKEATTESEVKPVKIDFGNGKYSAYMQTMFNESIRVFGFSRAKAWHFASNLCSDLGRAKISVHSSNDVTFGKTSSAGTLTIKEVGKTDKHAVVETPAITIARLITDLVKASRVGKTMLIVPAKDTDGEWLPLFDVTFNNVLEDWLAKAKPVQD